MLKEEVRTYRRERGGGRFGCGGVKGAKNARIAKQRAGRRTEASLEKSRKKK